MVKIKKIKNGETCDTYKVVSGGQGAYVSTAGFYVCKGSDPKAITKSVLAAVGITACKVVIVE